MTTVGSGRNASLACATALALLLAAAAAGAGEPAARIDMITEIAGADEGDMATEEELRRSGTEMIPANPEPSPPPESLPPPREEKMTEEAPAKPAPEPETMPAAERERRAAPAPAPRPMPATDGSGMASTAAMRGFYLRGEAGYSLAHDPDGSTAAGSLSGGDADGGGVFRGGLGYRATPAFRLELAGGYRTDRDVTATDSAGRSTATEVDATTAMLAAYVDITPVGDRLGSWMPYLGAGAGWARLETGSRSGGGGQPSEGGAETDNLTYALMLGVAGPLADSLTLDLGYRFQNLGEFENSGTLSDGTTQTATTWDALLVHELTVGLRYQF